MTTLTPEDICVSLDYAKRLKEAGWLYPSLFYWDSHAIQKTQGGYGITEDGEFAAPTAEEILRRLPDTIQINGEPAWLEILSDRDLPTDNEWIVCYSHGQHCDNELWVKNKWGLSNAIAAMYCLLAKNKLLPPEPHD